MQTAFPCSLDLNACLSTPGKKCEGWPVRKADLSSKQHKAPRQATLQAPGPPINNSFAIRAVAEPTLLSSVPCSAVLRLLFSFSYSDTPHYTLHLSQGRKIRPQYASEGKQCTPSLRLLFKNSHSL